MKRGIELHRRRRPWFLHDPAGMLIAGFSWALMIASLMSLWVSVSSWLGATSFWGLVEGTLLTTMIAMCMWSHFMVMTTDPGVVPLKKQDHADQRDTAVDAKNEASGFESESEEEIEMPLTEFEGREDDGSLHVFCDACNLYRPARAMHCDTCERCVILMDHHCPWVNNCVGAGNQKFFLLFLFYVAVTSAHVLLLLAVQRWSCRGGPTFCGFDAGKFPGRLGVWLLAASCAFGLFCIVMLAMEVYSIDDDPVYVSIAKRLHDRHGCKSKSRVERHLSVVFGTNGFDSSWFLPMPHQRSQLEWRIIGGFSPSTDDDVLC